MANPVINSILSFDGTMGTTVTYSMTGNVSYGNKILVYDSATAKLVYEYPKVVKPEKSPVKSYCIIPANVLTNGKRYYAQVQVADMYGRITGTSNKMAFYCLTTPMFRFMNVTEGQVIKSSHYDVTATYSQAEGEKLQSYRFGLYDKNKVLITESALMYDSNNISYRFKNLATNAQYYFRVSGVTVRGLVADSGFVGVSAQYTVKQDYAQLVLTNEYYKGYISYNTNIRLIGYDLDSKDYLFLNSGYQGSVDLTGRNPNYKRSIEYTNGFLIEGNWTMWLRGYLFSTNEQILTYSNEAGQYISISFHRMDNQCYFKLTISDGITKYIRYTKRIPYNASKIVTVFLRRHGTLANFKLFDGTETVDYGDISLYQDSNGNLFADYSGRSSEYFSYVEPALYYDGPRNLWYDSTTGALYSRTTN